MEPTKFQIGNVDNYINKSILISNNKNKDREGKQTNKERKKERKKETKKERKEERKEDNERKEEKERKKERERTRKLMGRSPMHKKQVHY